MAKNNFVHSHNTIKVKKLNFSGPSIHPLYVTFLINWGTKPHFTSVTVAGRKCTFKDDTESTTCKCQVFCLKEIRQQYDEQTDESRGCNLLCLMWTVHSLENPTGPWSSEFTECVRVCACMWVIRTLNASVSDKDSNCKITAVLSRHRFTDVFTIKIKNNQFKLWKQCSIFHYIVMSLSLQVLG